MKKITIRNMKKSDYNEVHKIDVTIQKEYIEFLGGVWDSLTKGEQNECLAVKQQHFNLYVDQELCFVAESNKKIIGFLLGYSMFNIAHVDHIAVLKLFRQQHVGKNLYLNFIDQANNKNISKIIALINIDNPKSKKLHKSLSFSFHDRIEAVLNLVK